MTPSTSIPHGYGGYSRGCRCDICREAKATYMRARRKVTTPAQAPLGTRFVAPLTRHGTRYGYEEKGCRCFACTTAHANSDSRYNRVAS